VSNQTPELPAVLVVDDDPTCRLMLTYLLQPHAGTCEIMTATDGAEALSYCERRPFRLIITDNRMPHVSGLELAAIVKSRWPETRIILISADMLSDGERRARELAVDHYLDKPFPIQQLRAIVASVLPVVLQEQSVGAK
jgi:CheY-like chemotaxis protein